jgi:hypothetical protein
MDHTAVVKVLVAKGRLRNGYKIYTPKSLDGDPSGASYETLLQFAARKADAELIELLLASEKIAVNYRAKRNDSALRIAVIHKAVEVVKILLATGEIQLEKEEIYHAISQNGVGLFVAPLRGIHDGGPSLPGHTLKLLKGETGATRLIQLLRNSL